MWLSINLKSLMVGRKEMHSSTRNKTTRINSKLVYPNSNILSSFWAFSSSFQAFLITKVRLKFKKAWNFWVLIELFIYVIQFSSFFESQLKYYYVSSNFWAFSSFNCVIDSTQKNSKIIDKLEFRVSIKTRTQNSFRFRVWTQNSNSNSTWNFEFKLAVT